MAQRNDFARKLNTHRTCQGMSAGAIERSTCCGAPRKLESNIVQPSETLATNGIRPHIGMRLKFMTNAGIQTCIAWHSP